MLLQIEVGLHGRRYEQWVLLGLTRERTEGDRNGEGGSGLQNEVGWYQNCQSSGNYASTGSKRVDGE